MEARSVANWMKMEIEVKGRVKDDGILSVSSLGALPIPEFFNCCSLSDVHEQAQLGIAKRKTPQKYTVESPPRKGRRDEHDKQREFSSHKLNWVQSRGKSPGSPETVQNAVVYSPPETRSKQIGRSLSAADARKLLKQMGVDEDSQPELNAFNADQISFPGAGSQMKSPPNPRVLVRLPNFLDAIASFDIRSRASKFITWTTGACSTPPRLQDPASPLNPRPPHMTTRL